MLDFLFIFAAYFRNGFINRLQKYKINSRINKQVDNILTPQQQWKQQLRQ